jgi:hypothetical protein
MQARIRAPGCPELCREVLARDTKKAGDMLRLLVEVFRDADAILEEPQAAARSTDS